MDLNIHIHVHESGEVSTSTERSVTTGAGVQQRGDLPAPSQEQVKQAEFTEATSAGVPGPSEDMVSFEAGGDGATAVPAPEALDMVLAAEAQGTADLPIPSTPEQQEASTGSSLKGNVPQPLPDDQLRARIMAAESISQVREAPPEKDKPQDRDTGPRPKGKKEDK